MSNKRILLVDDEPAFLRLAGAWLGAQGYEVVMAKDAAEARARFAAGRPQLVLLDLVMPPDRTPEAGLALIPGFSSVPVIVLTAHAEHELALRAVEMGAWDFLAKPVEPDLLKFGTKAKESGKFISSRVVEMPPSTTSVCNSLQQKLMPSKISFIFLANQKLADTFGLGTLLYWMPLV